IGRTERCREREQDDDDWHDLRLPSAGRGVFEQLLLGQAAELTGGIADADHARRHVTGDNRAGPDERLGARPDAGARRARAARAATATPGQSTAAPPTRRPRLIVGPFISARRVSVRPMKLSFVVTTHGAMKTSASSVEYAVTYACAWIFVSAPIVVSFSTSEP